MSSKTKVDRLVGGHQNPVLAVVRAYELMTVRCEPTLEEQGDGRVVFDDQDAHGMQEFNRVVRQFAAGTGDVPKKDAA
jgi:hypothetical protein